MEETYLSWARWLLAVSAAIALLTLASAVSTLIVIVRARRRLAEQARQDELEHELAGRINGARDAVAPPAPAHR